jgi:hypothetical protein
MEFKDFIAECRRPFPADAVLSRVQVTTATSALVVYYIDARHVSERLNQLIPGHWSDSYTTTEVGDQHGIQCTLFATVGEHTARVCDIGTKQANDDMGGLKAMYSDAFKRAAVKFGIGVSLYAQPTTWVPEEKNGTQFLKKNKAGKPAYLTDEAQDVLRDKYKKWLEDEGAAKFGNPVKVD